MMDDRWAALGESDWDGLAAAWISEMRGDADDVGAGVGMTVVLMNFTATADQQWRFIDAALRHADSDDELGHIAAGPFEQLLSKHGDDYIAIVERRATQDPQFARMATGAWRHMMTDEVWERLKAVQATCPEPLRPRSPDMEQ